MPTFNTYRNYAQVHSFKMDDVIKHVNAPNDLFFIYVVSSVGYRCFWFVDGEPACERGIGFLFEDEPFLMKIE